MEHKEITLTFRVVFDEPMSDQEITAFMKKVDFSPNNHKVRDLELVKLSK